MGAPAPAPQSGQQSWLGIWGQARQLAPLSLLCLLAGLVLGGCGSKGPAPVESRDGSTAVAAGYYRVREGDTLQHIALRHGLEIPQLAEWNGLEPPYRIYTGRLLRLVPDPQASPSPGPSVAAGKPADSKGPAQGPAGRAAGTATATKTAPAKPSESKAKPAAAKAGPGGLRWQWPLQGRVVQGFREGDRTRQGLRIAGRPGQLVAAAEGGTVVYSGSGLKGYGNLIIVKHNNEFLSAYGFNRRLLVKEGQKVQRGQSVAEIGQAGGGEHLLHFEIRRNGIATDPLAFLPRSR